MTRPRGIQPLLLILAAGALAIAPGCGRSLRPTTLPGQTVSIDELWQAPADLEQRDLFHGAGGAELMPRERSFEFVAADDTGWSPGFDVRDRAGLEWSVKLGPEAQTEIVASRILWAIGFHQPATYFLPEWTLTGATSGAQPAGRFRPDLPTRPVVGDWSWYENPFIGTRQYRGLVVANLILNSWDWKTSNNKIYQLSAPVRGVNRWFVVRDLGASLGKTTYPAILKPFRLRGFGQGTRNDLPGFESQGFIKHVDENGRIEFDYRGIYRDVLNSVTPADVRWSCELLARLSDQQWQAAFRAGGFTDAQTARYVAKIKSKVAAGLALPVS